MKQSQSKEYLFERMPVPGAALQLSTPIVISSLVTILYNLADTFFVGMLSDPVQNAAVTLVYPVTLAFNAVNNLFGVGVSSAMSRNLGRKAYDDVRTCSAFGFYGALCSGVLFSALCLLFRDPLLVLLGTATSWPPASVTEVTWQTLTPAVSDGSMVTVYSPLPVASAG